MAWEVILFININSFAFIYQVLRCATFWFFLKKDAKTEEDILKLEISAFVILSASFTLKFFEMLSSGEGVEGTGFCGTHPLWWLKTQQCVWWQAFAEWDITVYVSLALKKK